MCFNQMSTQFIESNDYSCFVKPGCDSRQSDDQKHEIQKADFVLGKLLALKLSWTNLVDF